MIDTNPVGIKPFSCLHHSSSSDRPPILASWKVPIEAPQIRWDTTISPSPHVFYDLERDGVRRPGAPDQLREAELDCLQRYGGTGTVDCQVQCEVETLTIPAVHHVFGDDSTGGAIVFGTEAREIETIHIECTCFNIGIVDSDEIDDNGCPPGTLCS